LDSLHRGERPGANGNIGVELVVRRPRTNMLFVTAPGPFSIRQNPTTPFRPAPT
jgi:hypothetical protein